MSSLPPTISVSLLDKSSVVLELQGEVSTTHRKAFFIYWGAVSVGQSDAARAELPIVEFLEKMEWLRSPWRDGGGQLTISDGVQEAVSEIRRGSKLFRDLKSLDPSRHKNKTINIPNISKDRALTNFQNENVLALVDMQNGANFSVPGAGKTLTTLGVWQTLRQGEKVNVLLVVCPRAAFESWESEVNVSLTEKVQVERYEGRIVNPDSQIVLINYEQLENPNKLSYLEQWASENSAMLVLDEAHRVKGGEKSVRWRAVRSLANKASRVDLLTGTPMPQGPSDLNALFRAAWPRLTRRDLDERFLFSLKRNTVFVRTTKGELELPPLEIRTISEEPGALQKKILDALADKYIGSNFLSIADSKNLAKRGKAVMTMLAASSNPALLVKKSISDFEMGLSWPPISVTQDDELGELIENYSAHEVPWKVRHVVLRAKEAADEGQKILVWSNFIGSLVLLKSALRDFKPALVYGSVANVERESELERFREDPSCHVLIANPQTLGEGVSLHEVCHHAVFVDRTFNGALYLQAIDRIHRLGLGPDQKTVIEILSTKGTIDEKVRERLEEKVRRLADFLEDEHLVNASLPAADEISPDEILGLDDKDFAEIAKSWGVSS